MKNEMILTVPFHYYLDSRLPPCLPVYISYTTSARTNWCQNTTLAPLGSQTSSAALLWLPPPFTASLLSGLGRSNKKKCKTGIGATSPPMMLTQLCEAKVSAQLWRAVTKISSFLMGLKPPLCFLCYLRPQLRRAKSKSCSGLLHSSSLWPAAS